MPLNPTVISWSFESLHEAIRLTGRPGDDNAPARKPTPLERAALRWVVRCESGLTGEQECALADWLGADSRHGKLFDEFGGAWRLMGRAHGESSTLVRDFRNRSKG